VCRLSDNHITDVGMQCLSSEGLPHCPLLVNLGYVCCCFQFHSTHRDFRNILSCVLIFRLSRNRITEVGWKHFLDVGLPHCLYIT